MTSLIAVQIVPQLVRDIAGHGEAHDNAALIHIAPEGRQVNPADDPRDVAGFLDGHAGHEQAWHRRDFSQRHIAASVSFRHVNSSLVLA